MARNTEVAALRAKESAPPLTDEAQDDLRTAVTVTRTHRNDIGIRHVVFRLDDGPKTILQYGQSFTLDVTPGTHRLRVHNTLFIKNLQFAVESGEHLEFMIINRGGAWTFSLLAWLGASPLFLTVQRRSLV